MKIRKIELENFRQFYGHHTLEFGTDLENVTIVLGANGNGKTGIFRAAMFALYGDMLLEQDGNVKNIHLVNMDKLDENLHMPVSAQVTLEFENGQTIYSITRKITSLKNGTIIDSQTSPAELYRMGEFGDFIKETEDPDLFINSILEKSIREFFFFDAEKMELLNTTKSSKKMSQEIKNGLIKLLQIKSLDVGGELLNDLFNKKNREIINKAKNGKLIELQQKKEEMESSKEVLEAEIEEQRSERILIKEHISGIENKLSSNEHIRTLQNEIKNVESNFQKEQSIYNEQKNNIKGMLEESFNLLALDILEKNEVQYDELLAKQSDTIPIDLIRHSLDACTCQVCRTRFEDDSNQVSVLKKLLEDYSFSDTTPTLQAIKRTTNVLREKKNSEISKFGEYIKKIVHTEENIEEYERALDRIKEQIKEKASLLANLQVLEQQLSTHQANYDTLEKEINRKHARVSISENDIEKIGKEIDLLTAAQEGLQHEVKILDKLKGMKEILSHITEDYTTEIIDVLSKEMTATFRTLLSSKDKNLFEKVVINTDYEISLLDKMGRNRVQDLSMGQGQIFTLAFITTLAKLASKGRQEIEFPLFMDTPFARLSRENRDNLIQCIPDLTNQWILLLTDTELTNVELEAFNRYGRVGRIYELVNKEGRTTVEEKADIKELEVIRSL